MTTLAMIFGMLPLAFALGEGAELRAPMAIAVIGGLITSTLLTLIVVPVVYTYLDGLTNRLLARRRGADEGAHEGAPRPRTRRRPPRASRDELPPGLGPA